MSGLSPAMIRFWRMPTVSKTPLAVWPVSFVKPLSNASNGRSIGPAASTFSSAPYEAVAAISDVAIRIADAKR